MSCSRCNEESTNLLTIPGPTCGQCSLCKDESAHLLTKLGPPSCSFLSARVNQPIFWLNLDRRVSMISLQGWINQSFDWTRVAVCQLSLCKDESINLYIEPGSLFVSDLSARKNQPIFWLNQDRYCDIVPHIHSSGGWARSHMCTIPTSLLWSCSSD